jgi:hypothetical protein
MKMLMINKEVKVKRSFKELQIEEPEVVEDFVQQIFVVEVHN